MLSWPTVMLGLNVCDSSALMWTFFCTSFWKPAAVMVALGMAAPVESAMRPVSWPLPASCAVAVALMNTSTAMSDRKQAHRRTRQDAGLVEILVVIRSPQEGGKLLTKHGSLCG